MGMIASNRDVEQEALTWLVRINDPDFSAWEEWTGWLEADPAHAQAYWNLAEREADAVEALKSLPRRRITPDRAPARRPVFARREVMAAGVAILVIGLGWLAWNERPQPWTIETGPHEIRTVALADGSRVSLAGGSRLILDHGDAREARLDQGRALFEVVHNASSPFRVKVDNAVLTDLGTTFDVTRLKESVRVSVSEGVVQVDQGAASATLNPGEGVLVTPRGLERRAVLPESVAAWRQGRLSYTGESLAVVGEDLQRALGRPVVVDPAAARRRFTGSLSVEPSRDDLRERLSRLLGVAIVEEGDAWRLTP